MPSSWHKANKEATRRRPGEPRGSGAVYIRRVHRQRKATARNWWTRRSTRGGRGTWTEHYQGKPHGLTLTRVMVMLAVVIIVVMVFQQVR